MVLLLEQQMEHLPQVVKHVGKNVEGEEKVQRKNVEGEEKKLVEENN